MTVMMHRQSYVLLSFLHERLLTGFAKMENHAGAVRLRSAFSIKPVPTTLALYRITMSAIRIRLLLVVSRCGSTPSTGLSGFPSSNAARTSESATNALSAFSGTSL